MTFSSTCPICSKGAQVLHELWIPKSAVMEALPEKRSAINAVENMALICNQCNMEMTHDMQVKIRRVKLIQMGQQLILDRGGLPGHASDECLIEHGIERVQAWLDSMQMKTRYDARRMAGLAVFPTSK